MQSAFKTLAHHKCAFLLCILIKAVSMAVYYAITFYILLALHIDVSYADFFFVMCGSSFAITAVVFVPTPGSSGGIEFAFESIFFSLAGGAITTTVAYGGMLIWRLLTYYLVMGISLLFYIALEIYFSVKAKREEGQNKPDENSQEISLQNGKEEQLTPEYPLTNKNDVEETEV
jgi:hypothetical protein